MRIEAGIGEQIEWHNAMQYFLKNSFFRYLFARTVTFRRNSTTHGKQMLDVWTSERKAKLFFDSMRQIFVVSPF